jgi:hypothetical protein
MVFSSLKDFVPLWTISFWMPLFPVSAYGGFHWINFAPVGSIPSWSYSFLSWHRPDILSTRIWRVLMDAYILWVLLLTAACHAWIFTRVEDAILFLLVQSFSLVPFFMILSKLWRTDRFYSLLALSCNDFSKLVSVFVWKFFLIFPHNCWISPFLGCLIFWVFPIKMLVPYFMILSKTMADWQILFFLALSCYDFSKLVSVFVWKFFLIFPHNCWISPFLGCLILWVFPIKMLDPSFLGLLIAWVFPTLCLPSHFVSQIFHWSCLNNLFVMFCCFGSPCTLFVGFAHSAFRGGYRFFGFPFPRVEHSGFVQNLLFLESSSPSPFSLSCFEVFPVWVSSSADGTGWRLFWFFPAFGSLELFSVLDCYISFPGVFWGLPFSRLPHTLCCSGSVSTAGVFSWIVLLSTDRWLSSVYSWDFFSPFALVLRGGSPLFVAFWVFSQCAFSFLVSEMRIPLGSWGGGTTFVPAWGSFWFVFTEIPPTGALIRQRCWLSWLWYEIPFFRVFLIRPVGKFTSDLHRSAFLLWDYPCVYSVPSPWCGWAMFPGCFVWFPPLE